MNITKIIQLLSDTGILGIVIFLFIAWFNRINPAVKTKIASNKSANQREVLGLLDNLASNAVHLLSASYEMPGDEKREKAVADVTSQLNGLGHNVDPAIISAAIEKAYQSMTTTETKAQTKQAEYNAALADTEQAFADKQAQLDKQAAIVPTEPAPLDVPEDVAATEGDVK
ncbi:phage holin, LLH family [Levilactobacillus brevis]|uniref:phage holin, LLH family n=1 Tax=Levilactobacillus brevis TaxID=1580 RepID=UPI000BE8447A|nr:phage holin, LLH family [Levilactobacillus brevis]